MSNESVNMLDDIAVDVVKELLTDEEQVTTEHVEEPLFSVRDTCEAFLNIIGRKVKKAHDATQVRPFVHIQKATAKRRLVLLDAEDEPLVNGPYVTITQPFFFTYFGVNYCIPPNINKVYLNYDKDSEDEDESIT